MTDHLNTRECVYIKGRAVLHRTAVRDWLCGTCGSALATRWHEQAPHWRTECAEYPRHEVDGFVHKSTWEYLQHRRAMETFQAADVLDHLPQELQDAILTRKEK